MQPKSVGPGRGELRNLDVLRFLAAFAILYHHSHEFLYAESVRQASAAPSYGLALFVDLFFIISGFVIAHVYEGRVGSLRSVGVFLRKRIARLYALIGAWSYLSWRYFETPARRWIDGLALRRYPAARRTTAARASL